MVTCSFVTNGELQASAECGLRYAVLRETQEEPLERSPFNLVIDFCNLPFLQNCVTVCSQDVIDADDPHAFTEEGKFCLRVLT